MAVRVQCPFCARALDMRLVPVPGQKLRCTGCTRTFPAPADLATAEATPAASAPAPDWALGSAAAAPPKPARVKAVSPRPATPPPLPTAVLTPIAPPAAPVLTPAPPPPSEDPDAPATGPRRGLLVGAVVGGLVLLLGSTVLAVALASRVDRTKKDLPVALNDPRDTDVDRAVTPNQGGDKEPDRKRTTTTRQGFNDDSPPAPSRDDARRGNDFPPPPLLEEPKVAQVSHTSRSTLSRELQDEVNKAIDKGVAHLKKTQLANGSWENGHPIGLAALPGLTLLECGVKPDDPVIQKAAKYVRDNVMKNNHSATYECSLALLFLDRLGDPKDKPLIRALAMRLVAGQLPGGGWTYGLPILTEKEERELVEFLERTRPDRKLDHMVRSKDDRKLESTVKSDDKGFYEALEGKKPEKETSSSDLVKDLESQPNREPSRAVKPFTLPEAKKAAEKVTNKARNAPAVTGALEGKPNKAVVHGSGDNSNTQFAMLALWAARRHNMPLERSLDAVGKRFRDGQNQWGGWGYHVGPNQGGSPAMTGAGLIGLAIGHGSATDPDRKFKVKDPQIDKGLKALSQHVGKPLGGQVVKKNKNGKVVIARQNTQINLYFLWTVERVGVLYDVKDLDSKDWYQWGVELLLPVQADEGSWAQGGYPGATKNVDTSFALLFLKRANLAKDLTQRLDFVVEGKPTR